MLGLQLLSRAQQICFIMGPLDMQGLVGAATIIGCLRYGASFSGFDEQEDLSSSSVSRMTTYWSRLMTRPSCKACGIHVQELMEFIRPLRWWVGGWGPRYLASKRERGPVRVPSSLTEDYN